MTTHNKGNIQGIWVEFTLKYCIDQMVHVNRLINKVYENAATIEAQSARLAETLNSR